MEFDKHYNRQDQKKRNNYRKSQSEQYKGDKLKNDNKGIR